jgi:hypothetical protein
MDPQQWTTSISCGNYHIDRRVLQRRGARPVPGGVQTGRQEDDAKARENAGTGKCVQYLIEARLAPWWCV